MEAGENMFVLNLVYATAVSTRVPSGYSLRLVNRKPPLDMSSHATTSSTPENRIHATIFIAVRRFLRRSSIGDAIDPESRSCSGELIGFCSNFSRPVSLHSVVELQFLQRRVNSCVP